MVIIRLQRGGRKNSPDYKITVADQRSRLGGRFIESVGTYTPRLNNSSEVVSINLDRINFWESKGAQLSDRVRSLIRRNEIREECLSTPPLSKAPVKSRLLHFQENIDKSASSSLVKAKLSWKPNLCTLEMVSDNRFTEWSTVTLNPFYRYLAIYYDLGYLAWARVATRRITYFSSGLRRDDLSRTSLLLYEELWDVEYQANWGVVATYRNMSIVLSLPLNDSKVKVDINYSLYELEIIKVELDECPSDFHIINYRNALSRIRSNPGEFSKAILKDITNPFKYKNKLTGGEASDFLSPFNEMYQVNIASVYNNSVLILRNL